MSDTADVSDDATDAPDKVDDVSNVPNEVTLEGERQEERALEDQELTPKVREGDGSLVLLFLVFLTLALIGGLWRFLSLRIKTLDEDYLNDFLLRIREICEHTLNPWIKPY